MSVSKSRGQAYLLLTLNTILWSVAPLVIKDSFQYIAPSTFLFYRFCLATLIFLPIFLLYRRHHRPRTNPVIFITAALLGTPLNLLPYFYGLERSTAIEASIIEATGPIFIILGGALLLKEKIRSIPGLLFALFGTLLLTLEPFILSHTSVPLMSDGNLLIIIGNLTWAAFILLSKKDHLDPIYLSFFSFLISIPFFFVVNVIENNGFALPGPAIPAISYMAIGGSVIAFLCYQAGLKHVEAGESAIFTYLRPLITIPLAIIFLKEGLTLIGIISIIAITVGVYLSEKH